MGVTVRRSVLVLACAAQAACVSMPVSKLYAGEARQRSEIVRIEKQPGLAVLSIDGRMVERAATPYILEVLPGRLVVVTQWQPDGMAYVPGSTTYAAHGTHTAHIDAVAGRVYYLRVQLQADNRWITVVWDCGTNDSFFKTIGAQCSALSATP